MIDEPPKLETAEERATRIWRNSQILSKTKELSPSPIDIPITWKTPNFRKMILEIFTQRRNDILTQYQIAIHYQKRRLLMEKLKRLERDDAIR